jgi:nitrite reductase/ring-hydroxylating ferredoxin subunit/uncharacterized membrane protein
MKATVDEESDSVAIPSRTLSHLLERVERSAELDGVASALTRFWSQVLSPQPVRDALSGRPIGHPAHPPAVSVTAGALMSATVIDLVGGPDARGAAAKLVAVGLVSATPTALAGWSDWLDTEQAEKRVGLIHATSNLVGLTAYGLSWLQRRRGGSGRGLGLIGAGALATGGWLGGHLVYAQGVGVDTTAFQSGPGQWTDVAAASRVTDALRQINVDGVAVLLTRLDGTVVALADRCTHRGGALSEGEREDDCVTCPWHGSAFDLVTGQVRRGPASRPQPVYETRERSGRVEIRRREPRALRTNPTGA